MTRSPRHRLARRSWLRLPRRTAQLRFTLLSGALFLLSGSTLLTLIYLAFDRASSGSARSPGRSQGGFPGSANGPPRNLLSQSQHHTGSAGGATAQSAADRHHLLVISAIALAGVTVLALLLGWFVAGRMLRPVRTITLAARRISATNLNQRLALGDADEEFRQLGDTLDDLFARLEASFDAQRHFVANASHELRTPLTAERTLLQVALANPATSTERWRFTGQELLASSHEQELLIEALLTLASSESGLDHMERVDLAVISHDVLLRPNPDTKTLGLQVQTAIGPAALDGDPRLIERLVANLIDNAARHNVAGGRLQITTDTTDGQAILTVTNTGPVIPSADLDRLFQPFQRLDPQRTHQDGHGLGLSIVRAIATAHRGTITACSQPEGGLSITVTFPPATQLVHPDGR